MDEPDVDSLGDCPPSAKLVFKVLEYDGPLTQKQIVEESMLSARTVRYALERLESIGMVDEDIYFADARQSLYRLSEPIAADGGLDDADAKPVSEDACCAE